MAMAMAMAQPDIYQLVLDLVNPEKREAALLDLSKKRESVQDLALILWYSHGTIAALLQEIVAIYPLLSPPKLKAQASNRVCNALALLQCVASNPETRGPLLAAHIPLFLYPFLNTSSKNRPFEFLRLTSLGVIGALVKVDDPDVVAFLLNTEIIPLCLRIMETGSDLSKTVATFILQKVLLDDNGLNGYICATYDRFLATVTVLSRMVTCVQEPPSPRLLKHIVRCYLRITENDHARAYLQQLLPECFIDGSIAKFFKDDKDPSTRKWLSMLYANLGIPTPPAVLAIPLPPPQQPQQPPQSMQQQQAQQQQMYAAAQQQQQGGNPYAAAMGMPMQMTMGMGMGMGMNMGMGYGSMRPSH